MAQFHLLLKRIDQNLKTNGIITRPASNGFWLSLLIPFAYLINIGLHWKAVPFDYKISSIAAFGILLESLIQLAYLARPAYQKTTICTSIIALVLAFLIWICLKQGVVFSVISGTSVIFLYSWLLVYLPQKFPHCFTMGEATIVCQGIVLFLFNCYVHLPYAWQNEKLSRCEEFKSILQIGLLGISTMSLAVYYFKFLRWTCLFFPTFASVVAFIILFPFTGNTPIVFLSNFVFNDLDRVVIVGAYLLLLCASAAAVGWQIRKKSKSLAIVRKIFHLLIVLVYIPGLIYQCTLLYLASLIVMALFLLLETIRLINLYPFADVLNVAVKAFFDEKDAGGVALTPIYLLIGCSAPMWLHPSPCDVTDSAGFNLFYLLAGILAVGVGDTAAGVFGSLFGKHKWPQSQKSVEGTLASITSQILVLMLLHSLKVLQLSLLNWLTACIGIIVNALVESKTDQVDNLILPLITFIIFSTSR